MKVKANKGEAEMFIKPQCCVVGCGCFLMFRPSAAVLELLRCVVVIAMQRYSYMKPLPPSLAVPTEVR